MRSCLTLKTKQPIYINKLTTASNRTNFCISSDKNTKLQRQRYQATIIQNNCGRMSIYYDLHEKIKRVIFFSSGEGGI